MAENNQKADRINEALRQLLNDYPAVEVDDLHQFVLKNSPLTAYAYTDMVHFTPAYSQRLAQKVRDVVLEALGGSSRASNAENPHTLATRH